MQRLLPVSRRSTVEDAEANLVAIISNDDVTANDGKTPLLPLVQPERRVRQRRSHRARGPINVSANYTCRAAVDPAWTGVLSVLLQALFLATTVCMSVAAKQQGNMPYFYGAVTAVILQVTLLLMSGAGDVILEFMDMHPKQGPIPSAAGKAALDKLIRLESVPQVDLFIACCKEPLDIIQDTTLAALTQDYPPLCYIVYLLDDGGDDALKLWVAEKSRTWDGTTPKLVYIRRTKEPGKCSHYKAGNMNHGLRCTSAPYVAQLDADMIPTAGFLRTLMAALLEEPKAGYSFCTQVRS